MRKFDKRMAVVRIGVDYFLMPEAQALKVFATMSDAVRVTVDYNARSSRWIVAPDDGLARVEIRSVKPADIGRPADPLMIEGGRS